MVFKLKNSGIMLCLLITYICIEVSAQSKKICLTFDDLPVVSYGVNDSSYKNNVLRSLISSLMKNKIPAVGFINEYLLYSNDKLDQSLYNLIEKWLENGLELGNHTYSHYDYHTVSFKKYTEDIIKGKNVSDKIAKKYGTSIRYFRHPYLHIGNTKAKADSLSAFLSKNNYIAAPVTIDNEEYKFAAIYHKAFIKKDTTHMQQIGSDYIAYMEKKLNYFAKNARLLFNREINHIMLVHSNLLNSVYIDSLINMINKNHYSFISLETALSDSVYKTPITSYGNWGISWVDRWALSKGKRGDFFKEEPVAPEYIQTAYKNSPSLH